MAGREGRLVKLSVQGLKQAEQALLNFESQADLAAQLQMSRTTVSKFLAGKESVALKTFRKICKKLKLNWQEVADLPKNVVPAADEQEQNKGDDIDALVQKVRALCREKVQYQCGTMQLLDVSHSVELDNLYVDVNILEDIPSRRWIDISKRLQDFDPSADDFDRFYLGDVRQERVPGLEAAANNLKLMVLGKPGSGKTTFLKHLAIECNKGNFQADRVPIFIGLKRFTDHARNSLVGAQSFVPLREYISQKLQSCDVAAADVESLLKQGRALILLDGLDEVSERDSEAVRQQITRLSEQYYKNQFVITCRTQAQQYMFEGFTHVEVADFTQEQIESFAKKWFVALARNSEQEGLARAAEFVKKLKHRANKRVRELVVTPILLSLTCLVFNDLEDLPTNRAKLYEQGLNILLTRWDEARGITRDEIYRNLSLPRKIKLLSQVAAITFEQGAYFFEQNKIQQLIANYIHTFSNTNIDSSELQVDSKAVLKSIESQHGLLIERAREIYSFSHLTFQEYFTAKNLAISSESQVFKQLVSHFSNPSEAGWREVFLLANEISWNSESLMLLKNQIDEIVASEQKLQQLLNWVNQKALSIKVFHRPASVRAFYFSLAHIRILGVVGVIRVFDLVLNTALDYAFDPDPEHSFNLDLTLDFALHRVLNHKCSFTFDLNFTLNRILNNTLDPELKRVIQQLKEQLPDPYKYKERFDRWWLANGQAWTKNLRAAMIEYRNIGHSWQFCNHQKEFLKQYYNSTVFLVKCLNSASNVSPEVRQEIEATLLLPIAEIEKRKGLG